MESTATVQDGLKRNFRADELNVYIYESRPKMGQAAASVIAAELRRAIQERGRATLILASAPSQNEFLSNLAGAPDIDWTRVTAFHLDEYLGMDDQAPQSFRRFLIDRLVNKVPLGAFHGLRGDAPDGTAKQSATLSSCSRIPPTLLCSVSEKTVIWRLSIRRFATSTIPNQ
jgi:glucosamine-6-phosphate deaminase